jgi:hypothetical protein
MVVGKEVGRVYGDGLERRSWDVFDGVDATGNAVHLLRAARANIDANLD